MGLVRPPSASAYLPWPSSGKTALPAADQGGGGSGGGYPPSSLLRTAASPGTRRRRPTRLPRPLALLLRRQQRTWQQDRQQAWQQTTCSCANNYDSWVDLPVPSRETAPTAAKPKTTASTLTPPPTPPSDPPPSEHNYRLRRSRCSPWLVSFAAEPRRPPSLERQGAFRAASTCKRPTASAWAEDADDADDVTLSLRLPPAQLASHAAVLRHMPLLIDEEGGRCRGGAQGWAMHMGNDTETDRSDDDDDDDDNDGNDEDNNNSENNHHVWLVLGFTPDGL